MKLTIKTKADRTDIYTIRFPVPLIQRLKQLRTRADKLGVDFTASICDLMTHAADEFEAYLQEKETSVHEPEGSSVHDSYTKTPSTALTPNGSDPEHS